MNFSTHVRLLATILRFTRQSQKKSEKRHTLTKKEICLPINCFYNLLTDRQVRAKHPQHDPEFHKNSQAKTRANTLTTELANVSYKKMVELFFLLLF